MNINYYFTTLTDKEVEYYTKHSNYTPPKTSFNYKKLIDDYGKQLITLDEVKVVVEQLSLEDKETMLNEVLNQIGLFGEYPESLDDLSELLDPDFDGFVVDPDDN
jgi:hypothetical protein